MPLPATSWILPQILLLIAEDKRVPVLSGIHSRLIAAGAPALAEQTAAVAIHTCEADLAAGIAANMASAAEWQAESELRLAGSDWRRRRLYLPEAAAEDWAVDGPSWRVIFEDSQPPARA